MRRLVGLTAVLVLVPGSVAIGADLEELLERSHEGSYSAEQIISCSTPDGVQDAVVRLRQTGGEIHVGTPVGDDLSVASGYGGFTLFRRGDVVDSALVESEGGDAKIGYALDDGTKTVFLGRAATRYGMFNGDLLRAELVTDDRIGALLRVTTYTSDGDVYCERRFITFDATSPSSLASDMVETEPIPPLPPDGGDEFPADLAGFTRLDLYDDEEGLMFGYYSDGFFSFAVFQAPTVVELAESTSVTFEERAYDRFFTPGHVTYSWETRNGGMALVGDLPPDMHEAVLLQLPEPDSPGLFTKLWRRLFG